MDITPHDLELLQATIDVSKATYHQNFPQLGIQLCRCSQYYKTMSISLVSLVEGLILHLNGLFATFYKIHMKREEFTFALNSINFM